MLKKAASTAQRRPSSGPAASWFSQLESGALPTLQQAAMGARGFCSGSLASPHHALGHSGSWKTLPHDTGRLYSWGARSAWQLRRPPSAGTMAYDLRCFSSSGALSAHAWGLKRQGTLGLVARGSYNSGEAQRCRAPQGLLQGRTPRTADAGVVFGRQTAMRAQVVQRQLLRLCAAFL